MKLKLITWQGVAGEFNVFVSGHKYYFIESLVTAHLSYNFLKVNKRGKRICSEGNLLSLIDLLFADYLDMVRSAGKWQREYREQGKDFFVYLAELTKVWEAESATSRVGECIKKIV